MVIKLEWHVSFFNSEFKRWKQCKGALIVTESITDLCFNLKELQFTFSLLFTCHQHPLLLWRLLQDLPSDQNEDPIYEDNDEWLWRKLYWFTSKGWRFRRQLWIRRIYLGDGSTFSSNKTKNSTKKTNATKKRYKTNRQTMQHQMTKNAITTRKILQRWIYLSDVSTFSSMVLSEIY